MEYKSYLPLLLGLEAGHAYPHGMETPSIIGLLRIIMPPTESTGRGSQGFRSNCLILGNFNLQQV